METIKPKSKKHWLELRSQDITSTEISALFNASPYLTEFELWHRKKNKTVIELEENERMKWGNILEEAIAEGIADEQNWMIMPMKEYIRDEELRIGSSFDFRIEDHIDQKGIQPPELLEIKNVDSLQFKQKWIEKEDGDYEAPLHIEAQIQHQLLVSGMNIAYIGVLIGGNNLKLLKRERNENIMEGIRTLTKVFWKSVDENKPPEPNFESDANFISSLYGYSEPGKVCQLDDNQKAIEMMGEYGGIGDDIKGLEAKRKAIKAELLTMIGDSEKAYGDQYTISAGMVGPTHVEYDRKGYRLFKITRRK